MSNGNKNTLEDNRKITVRILFDDFFDNLLAEELSDSDKFKPACDI